MTINFLDAVHNNRDLEYQIEAWKFLQRTVHKEVLDEFARLYLNEKIMADSSGLPIPGVELIKQFEGCILKAYYDPLTGGLPITIGWGSTRRKDGSLFMIGNTITQQEADDLLYYQLKKDYLPSLTKIPYWENMNENQQGALLSFAYNLGANFYNSNGFNTITRVLRNKEWNKVPETFKLYRNPGSSVEAGLLRRRTAECKLWEKK